MHIASQAGHALNEKEIIQSDDIEILRLSGLLHDIGHGPFSHLFEEIIQEKKFHMKILVRKLFKNLNLEIIYQKMVLIKNLSQKLLLGIQNFNI